jgi:hypothetical protein
MSNMSTKIEDLPGGPIEPVEMQVQEQSENSQRSVDLSKYNENNSNIHANISPNGVTQLQEKQLPKEKMSIVSELRSQITEENALLFVIFVIFTTNRINNYIGGIPGFDKFIKNEMSLVLLKSGLAVLTFIIIKRFVLSKFSL